MRIASIEINNIRSYEATKLELEPFTVVWGSNASGKTSFEQAIEFALTGRSESTGANGQGATELIRTGQDKASIILSLANGRADRTLRASLTRKSGRDVTVKSTAGDAEAASFKERIAAIRNVLSCLCNNRFFVDLKPAEQKDLLASIVLADAYDFPAAKIKLAADAGVTAGVNWGGNPVEAIDRVYTQSFEARKAAKRDLNLNPMPSVSTEDAPDAARLEQIKVTLAELRHELTTLEASKASAESDLRDWKTRHKAAKEKIESLDSRGQAEHREYTDAQARLLKKPEIAALKKTAELAAAVAEINKKIAIKNARIEAFNEQELKLKGIDAVSCPTCSQEVSTEFLENAYAFIANERDVLRKEVGELFDKLKELGDPVDAQRKLDNHEATDREVNRLKGRLEEIKTDTKAAKEDFAALEENKPTVDTSVIDEKIATLKGRIAKGEDVLTSASNLAGQAKVAAEARAKRRDLEVQVARLDSLCEYFGPNGVKAELIAAHIEAFTDKMNAVLNRWGYNTRLSLEPYEFMVKRLDNDRILPLELLSKSEQYRFAVAFQVALAITTGIRFVVVDAVDILDQTSRSAVNKALYEAGLDQVIVMATDQRVEAPEIEGSVFIGLSMGADGITRAKVLSRKSQPAAA